MKLRIALVAVVLLITGLSARNISHGAPIDLLRPLARFPTSLGEWESLNIRLESEIEEKVGVTDYLYRVFSNPAGDVIHFYVGYYSSQQHGQMIHSPKNCLPGNGWYISRRGAARLDLPPYPAFDVNDFIVENGSHKQVVLYWYQQAGGRIVTNEYLGRVFLVLDAARKNRTDAALVRVNIPIRDSAEESFRTGVEFLKSAYPELMEFLPDEDPSRPS